MSNASSLPLFRPIEEIFPYWMTARAIIEPLLPTHFTASMYPIFLPPTTEEEAEEQERKKNEARRSSLLNMNTDWAQRMVDLAPREDLNKLVQLLIKIGEVFASEFKEVPDLLTDSILGQPATPMTLSQLGALGAACEEERKRSGTLTFSELAAHVLGIRPAPGSQVISFVLPCKWI